MTGRGGEGLPNCQHSIFQNSNTTPKICGQTCNFFKTSLSLDCVVPEKLPYPPHGRSLEIPRGRRGSKFLEAMYENNLEFPGGEWRCKTKTCGGSMDIFWNSKKCKTNLEVCPRKLRVMIYQRWAVFKFWLQDEISPPNFVHLLLCLSTF